MSLSVIGAGFGRTGTMSLKLALEQLGLGPCHHMAELHKHPRQVPAWQAAAAGEAVDWDAVLAGYKSTVDWPSAHYWRTLADHFPAAKILLSTRPPERWWASFSETIAKVLETHGAIDDPNRRAIIAMAHVIVTEKTFAGAPGDKQTALAAYQKRIDDVTAAIPPERLLVFDVAEGWAPLCAFVGLPIPDTAFPHANSREEFWQNFGPDQR